MTRLPVISGRECAKALQRAGFILARQRGSHMVLYSQDPPAQVAVPDHRELDRGTLRSLLRLAGVSVEDFVRLLSLAAWSERVLRRHGVEQISQRGSHRKWRRPKRSVEDRLAA